MCEQKTLFCLAGLDDFGETADFKARPADQGSVDVRLAQKLLGVGRLHTAAILDANFAGSVLV